MWLDGLVGRREGPCSMWPLSRGCPPSRAATGFPWQHEGPWVGQVTWVASDTFATVCATAFESRPRKMVPIILSGVD